MSVDLETLTLSAGSHASRADGVCIMEAVAWWAGEKHTDAPACASPVLTSFAQSLNDRLPDDKRQQLRQFIPSIPGTRGDGLDEQRGYLALDWLIRTYTPAWLDLAGLAGEAAQLRDLAPVAGLDTARAAAPAVRIAKEKAAAARDAARDAALDAARAAALDAALDAALAAAGAAARDAAWDAARAAAWDAALDAAWDAALDAALDAARAAALDAARDAAGAALSPVVASLQDSAIVLFGAMISPRETSGQIEGDQPGPGSRARPVADR